MYTEIKAFLKKLSYRFFVNSKRKNFNFLIFTLILLAISRIAMLVIFIMKYGSAIQFVETMTSVWDNGWYSSIITDGYDKMPSKHLSGDAANWAFFPLSPMLIKFFSLNCLLDYRIVGMVVNTLLFALAITVVFKYAGEVGLSLGSVYYFTFFMVFGPYSFYFSSLYTESLFMLLTMLYLYEMNKKNYLLMGVFGAMLSATRVTGVFMVFSTLIFVIYKHLKEKNGGFVNFLKDILQNHKLILGVCLVPLGMFSYMLFLKLYTGDALAFMHIQKAWGRTDLFNGASFINGLKHYFNYAVTPDVLVNLHYYLVTEAIILTIIYQVSRRPHECVPYFFPCAVNFLTLGFVNTARYSIGTGIFVLNFSDMLTKSPKWLKAAVCIAVMVCAYYMQLSWFEAHFVTIG